MLTLSLSKKLSSVPEGKYVPRKARTNAISFLRSFTNVAFETVPVLVRQTVALSHPILADCSSYWILHYTEVGREGDSHNEASFQGRLLFILNFVLHRGEKRGRFSYWGILSRQTIVHTEFWSVIGISATVCTKYLPHSMLGRLHYTEVGREGDTNIETFFQGRL